MPTGSASGTGLGLAIVRHIALTRGGSGKPHGDGSVFRLRLPAPKNSA
ncbi:MAG: hypothetical protein LBF83_02850 [Spirochaetaceae bacterium]|nr:hypothetical protein [Spirochaetaceae bacterium]